MCSIERPRSSAHHMHASQHSHDDSMQPQHMFIVEIAAGVHPAKVLFGVWEGSLVALVKFQAATWAEAKLTVFECTEPALTLPDAVVCLTGSSCGWHESELDSQPQL